MYGRWVGAGEIVFYPKILFFINCESAIGQHLLTNPECAKTYTDDNFRIIGQGRSSFHLSVLESVYIKTQNPVLCKQKDFIFSLGIFK